MHDERGPGSGGRVETGPETPLARMPASRGRRAGATPGSRRPRARSSRPSLTGTLLVLATLAGVAGAWWWFGAERDLAMGRERLAAGDASGAAPLLAAAARSPWHAPRARSGLALAAALVPQAVTAASAGPMAPLRTLPLRATLDAALAARDPEALLRIAALPGAEDDPLLALYEAAALAALGRDADAAALRDAAPALFASHELGRRVSEALTAHQAGAALVVRDRRGRWIGTREADGTLATTRPEVAEWVPGPAREALASWSSSPALRLSLDLDVSEVAATALGRHRGSIVVLDAHSGEVLATVSDARSRRRGATPAFEERREPASIMKVLTAAAALRAGRDPDAEIARMRCLSAERYSGQVLWCSYRAGPLLGLDHAMAISCNIAFANLGVSLGREAIVDELRRWGFDRPDLPGAGRILVAEGDDRQLADLSIGLEATDITPLHAALLAAGVANAGVMPEPTLVAAQDGPLGLSPEPLPRAPGRRVIPESLVPVLRRAMEAVTDYGGTAASVGPPNYPVAMKTGTAAEWRRGYHVNYVGFGTLPDADLAFCVRLTYQPSSYRVRNAAKLVTRRLLEGLAGLHARRLVLPATATS